MGLIFMAVAQVHSSTVLALTAVQLTVIGLDGVACAVRFTAVASLVKRAYFDCWSAHGGTDVRPVIVCMVAISLLAGVRTSDVAAGGKASKSAYNRLLDDESLPQGALLRLGRYHFQGLLGCIARDRSRPAQACI